MQATSVEVYVSQTRERLAQLERERGLHERALDTSDDPQTRARRWQSLARIEEEIGRLQVVLDAVDGW